MRTVCCTESLEELKLHESMIIFGGAYSPAEIVGLGIGSAILFGYFGTVGIAYAYYNFFKNS